MLQLPLTLPSLFISTKSALHSSFLPFLETVEDLSHLLLLCRSSRVLISEHFMTTKSDRLFRLFLPHRYLIPKEELEIILKEFKIKKRSDMIKIDDKLIKAKGEEFGYYRYKLNYDMFEILAHAGQGWTWCGTPEYYT